MRYLAILAVGILLFLASCSSGGGEKPRGQPLATNPEASAKASECPSETASTDQLRKFGVKGTWYQDVFFDRYPPTLRAALETTFFTTGTCGAEFFAAEFPTGAADPDPSTASFVTKEVYQTTGSVSEAAVLIADGTVIRVTLHSIPNVPFIDIRKVAEHLGRQYWAQVSADD